MIFYHGTTTNIKVNKVLLPPNETGVLREDFRKTLQDKVFRSEEHTSELQSQR